MSESISMKHKEARGHIFKVFKHKYEDHDELHKIINEVINSKTEMATINSYWTFQHKEFKAKIEERINYIHKKIR